MDDIVLHNMSTLSPNTTGTPDTVGGPLYLGFIASAVAVVFFGSNFVPVKKFETGDGMFFQWVLCTGIWCTGLMVYFIRRETSEFVPLVMLGGFLWETGNIMVVPIIKAIGLAQGILVWGTVNLLGGWVTGRFGLFGLKAETPHHEVLNYVGVSLCVLSGFIYALLKTDTEITVSSDTQANAEDTDPLINDDEHGGPLTNVTTVHTQEPQMFVERLSPKGRRILGIVLSVISGLLYGVNFTPVIYITDHVNDENSTYYGMSDDGIDYVFCHFSGIFLTSTVYFAIYAIFMKNSPRIYARAILPALLSGIMWAIADASWFVANTILLEAVAFPIITTGPGMVGAIWGLVLKEIRGVRNYVILAVAFSITITGSILTGLSKVENL